MAMKTLNTNRDVRTRLSIVLTTKVLNQMIKRGPSNSKEAHQITMGVQLDQRSIRCLSW